MMIRSIIHLYKQRKIRKERRQYTDGYDYAAGELLRGKTVTEVESYPEVAREFGTYGNFDDGIESAIEDWRKLNA